MFRFTIRDVLWLMVVVGLAVCLWIDHRSLVRLSAKSKADQAKLEKQQESLFWLVKENSELQQKVRRGQVLKEAKPGVFYLGPGNSSLVPR
jgi:hypothetical protein